MQSKVSPNPQSALSAEPQGRMDEALPRYPDPDAFWDNVRGSGECWVWIGRRKPGGYGEVAGLPYTETSAHRLSWTMANGPIPGGKWVLHHCDNPPCVNPAHLYIGTAADNARDREARGRGNHRFGLSHPGTVRTHCVNGHEFTDETVIRFGDGGRRCRVCARTRRAAYKARRRQAARCAA